MAFIFKANDIVVRVRDEHPPAHVHVESPQYDDGPRHAWPVNRLEMLKNTPAGFKPVVNPPTELLSDVQVYGGGTSIYWEKLEQIFSVDDLLSGVYAAKSGWTA